MDDDEVLPPPPALTPPTPPPPPPKWPMSTSKMGSSRQRNVEPGTGLPVAIAVDASDDGGDGRPPAPAVGCVATIERPAPTVPVGLVVPIFGSACFQAALAVNVQVCVYVWGGKLRKC